MSGRAAEAAAVAAVALALTVAVAAPVLRAPSERIFGVETVGRHPDPFTAMEQFDRPMAAGIYLQPLADVPGALFARLWGPVAAYNLIVLLTFPLAAVVAWALGRHLGLSPLGAAIAALAFAFSPFHLAHSAYHPQVAQTQWMALYLLALWRCLDAASPARTALLAASIAGVTLSNFYGGLIAAVITPVAVAAYWSFGSRREPGSRRRLAITLATLGITAGLGAAYAWYAAPAVVADGAAFAFEREDLFRYSAKWWSYLVPPVAHPFLGRPARAMWDSADVTVGLLEQQVTLGWGVVALGCVAVFAWIRSPRGTAPVAAVPILASVAIAALVCSLSPERSIGSFTMTRPSALLYHLVPMFRSYARFGVVVQLMAVLLAGIGAEWLWRKGRRARVACAALAIAAAAEYAVWPPAMWRDVLPSPAHRWVARQPDALRVLDCSAVTPASASVPRLTAYRVSLSGGWFDDCTEPNLAVKLAAAGYTHLLVPRTSPDAAAGIREGLRPAARFDEADVFAVTAPVPVVYTAGMTGFYPREYGAEWTWRWMGPRASWRIVNTSNRTIVAAVDVEMTALAAAQRLTLLVDGREIQTVDVAQTRAVDRIGPVTLAPGDHELTFRPVDPPAVADAVLNNGDGRALSFAIGAWRWTCEGGRP